MPELNNTTAYPLANTIANTARFPVLTNSGNTLNQVTLDTLLTCTLSPTYGQMLWVDADYGTTTDYYPLRFGPGVGEQVGISFREDPGGPTNLHVRLGGVLGTQTVQLLAASTPGHKLGTFGTDPVIKQEVPGATGGNAALQSLISCLTNYGIVTNSAT